MATTQPEHISSLPSPCATASSDWVRGTRVHGRFTIERLLGRGGMGEVYEAQDAKLRRPVAIKVWHRPIGDAAAEATILAQLNHPNVLTIYEFVMGDPALLVMALVRGTSLDRHLSPGRRLSRPDFFTIARQITAGLAACHEQGVLHRDVKPANILLTDRADGLHAILIDFGIAALRRRHEHDTSTFKVSPVHSNEVWGSRLYMPPEQWDGARLTPAADIYSLGCVLFEMLAGSPPFLDLPDLQFQHREGPRPVPSQRVRWVPPLLDHLVADMLAPDPEDRPTDARAVLIRLSVAAESLTTSRRGRPLAIMASALLGVGVLFVLRSALAPPPRESSRIDELIPPVTVERAIPPDLVASTPSDISTHAIEIFPPPGEPASRPATPRLRSLHEKITSSAEAVLSADNRATIVFGPGATVTVRDDNLMDDAAQMLQQQLARYAKQNAGLVVRCERGRCTANR